MINTRVYLHIGPSITEGDLNSIDLIARYKFQALSDTYRAKFNSSVGFVNVTDIAVDLLNAIRREVIYSNMTIRENEQLLSYKHPRIITTRGTIVVHQKFLFLDKCRVEDYVSSALGKFHLNAQFE